MLVFCVPLLNLFGNFNCVKYELPTMSHRLPEAHALNASMISLLLLDCNFSLFWQ